MSRTHVRIHVDAPTDPKWLAIAAACGCVPGTVWSTWSAVLAHARRRGGSALEFDIEQWSAFSGYADDVVRALIRAFEQRGLLDASGRPAKWSDHNPSRPDPTAAERQQRRRDRVRLEKDRAERVRKRDEKRVTRVTNNGISADPTVTRVTESSVTRVTSGGARTSHARDADSDSHAGVTQRHAGGDYRGGAVGSSCTSSNHYAPNNLPRTPRACNAGEIFDRLTSVGIGYVARKWNTARVREWIASGLTLDQLDEAIERAEKARQREQSGHPLNMGFIAVHVADVIAGRPARSAITPTPTLEACDAAAAEFLATRGAR